MSTIKTLDLALIDLRAGLSKELHLSQVALADITRAFNTAFESMEALQATVNNAFIERNRALEMAIGTAPEKVEQPSAGEAESNVVPAKRKAG